VCTKGSSISGQHNIKEFFLVSTLIQSTLNSYSELFFLLSSLLGSSGLAAIFLSVLLAIIMTPAQSWAAKIAAEESKIQAVISR
jgi:hypothetical protein